MQLPPRLLPVNSNDTILFVLGCEEEETDANKLNMAKGKCAPYFNTLHGVHLI